MKTADFVQDHNTYLRVTGHIQLAHRGTKAKAPPSRHPLTWLGETEPRICQCPNAIDRGFAGSAPVALRPRRDGLHQLCIDRVSFPWRIRHDSATASGISPREVESHSCRVSNFVANGAPLTSGFAAVSLACERFCLILVANLRCGSGTTGIAASGHSYR